MLCTRAISEAFLLAFDSGDPYNLLLSVPATLHTHACKVCLPGAQLWALRVIQMGYLPMSSSKEPLVRWNLLLFFSLGEPSTSIYKSQISKTFVLSHSRSSLWNPNVWFLAWFWPIDERTWKAWGNNMKQSPYWAEEVVHQVQQGCTNSKTIRSLTESYKNVVVFTKWSKLLTFLDKE